ncbi:MAG: tetratricopeptide repeat protein [Thermoanaerobaculia bacterium]
MKHGFMKAIVRPWSPAVTVFCFALAGCSGYEPINPQVILYDDLAKRVGPERAKTIAVPFEINDEIRAALRGRAMPIGREKTRTSAILDFVFESLDLQYSLSPTRDAIGTYQARSGNCLSFVNLFVGMAREVRLNPFYVEVTDFQRWNYRDGVVVSQGHIVAGMSVDGNLSTFDFLPYRAKTYRDFEPIDDLTAIAHYYNNIGAEALLDDDLEKALDALTLAVDLDPDFNKALNNLGVYYLRTGRAGDAVSLFREALARDPADVALMTNLARALQTRGEVQEASELLAQLDEVGQTSPFFFIYRAEMALGDGDTAKALEYMRQALRRDSEVPEVHVGLVKVYLALGEMGKARHHLERALVLDATNQEARQFAVMLQAAGHEN